MDKKGHCLQICYKLKKKSYVTFSTLIHFFVEHSIISNSHAMQDHIYILHCTTHEVEFEFKKKIKSCQFWLKKKLSLNLKKQYWRPKMCVPTLDGIYVHWKLFHNPQDKS